MRFSVNALLSSPFLEYFKIFPILLIFPILGYYSGIRASILAQPVDLRPLYFQERWTEKRRLHYVKGERKTCSQSFFQDLCRAFKKS